MLASDMLRIFKQSGIDFYTGVPDSQLKGFCDELYAQYGTDSPHHLVAHNEGGAIALCAGHYLASGRPGLCYMQNSGLGNAVNPLASLMAPEVYGMPCLLLIGWRGEPGIHDEPQHVKQGAITLQQLDILGIPWFILSADMSVEAFADAFSGSLSIMRQGRTAAIVVRKGAIQSDQKPDYRNHYSMTREKAVSLILKNAGASDIFVCTTGKLSREVFELREGNKEDHSRDFLTVGSMGHASMIALEIALEKPDRTVWCLDGDGAGLMHLGAFPLIGQRAPSNLIHVVINNGAHETVGGMPVLSRTLNIASIASASGYRHVLSAENETELIQALQSLQPIASEGPVLMNICCSCGARRDLGRPTTTPQENRNALMAFLNKYVTENSYF